MAFQPVWNGLITSESVCSGHPDKICDQISDAIVDDVLARDPYGHVAAETLVTKDFVCIAGEIRSTAAADVELIARQQIRRLGYTDIALDFTADSPISIHLHQQSEEIAAGVDNDGAGDQGMMYGFACSETATLMPTAIMMAHRLAETLDNARETSRLPYLRPDGKTQVTLMYENGKPVGVEQIVAAVPHRKDVPLSQVKQDVFEMVSTLVSQEFGFKIAENHVLVNGTGVWHYSGPAADTGLTGRKIIVDSYGGYARVGGGAFSGKDPTKVDRSGAYYARFIAKNLVAHGLMGMAEVRLAYAIGQQKPVSVEIEDFGTAHAEPKVIQSALDAIGRKSVAKMIEDLELRYTQYLPTATYGHFGKEAFPWEKVAAL
jgi:S-adenosylmethionine synthetase